MMRAPVGVKLPVFGSFEKVDLVVLRPDHGCIYVAWDPTETLVQRLGVAAVQFAKGREAPVFRPLEKVSLSVGPCERCVQVPWHAIPVC